MKKSKIFLITIDTEADNQWDKTSDCTTYNAKYLPRFQELSEKYTFKPTWLTTYEMANNNQFVKYFKRKQDDGFCEIGMHLHAWNTPPDYELHTITKEKSYLIEYPIEIIEKKIQTMDDILTNKFGIKPISHRAGRWAINDDYINLLAKYGYKIDCSVTPHISWKKNLGETGIGGSNYTNFPEYIYPICNGVVEMPMTIRKIRFFDKIKVKNFKSLVIELIYLILKKKQWVRPDCSYSLKGIKKVMDICSSKNDYIMFMIHSSELMPNGSPRFKTKNDIEMLYNNIEEIFKYANKLGYKGMTLKEFYMTYCDGDVNGEDK